MRLALLLLLASAAHAQLPAPAPAEQQVILARVRAAADEFAGQLQDFTCTQSIVRTTARPGPKPRWKPLDTQETDLTYFAHKEHHKILSINGKPVGGGNRVKAGYFIPGGEFGAAFRRIFVPDAKAQFEWDHVESSASGRACVFRYRVPLETTSWNMQVNLDTVPMAHRGFIYADCASGALERVQSETDPAFNRMEGRDIPVGLKVDVRYGPVTIASKEFLAPIESDETALFGGTLTRVQIRFNEYRKYDSSSTITYGEPGKGHF